MASKRAGRSSQHVVAIPYPAQGHINPMLQLCRQLVPFGFSFTFINIHHIHQRVQYARPSHTQGPHAHDAHQSPSAPPHSPLAHHGDDVSVSHAPFDAYDGSSSIRMLSVAGGLPPEEHAHDKFRWNEAFNATLEMQEPVEELISHIMRREQGVAFILSDLLLRWCGTTAHKFSLPWVCFWPASAATCSAFFYFSELAAEGKRVQFAEKEGTGEGGIVEGIPGLPPSHVEELPSVCDSRTGKVEHVVLESFVAGKGAGWLLLNTFEEIEGQVLEALRKRIPATVALGPLLPAHYMLHTCSVAAQKPGLSLFPEDERCLAWLDSQAPSSVVFISFGSVSLRSEPQRQELALGVQATGCPFLLVRRPDINSGFTHDYNCPDKDHACHTESRGLIVPWAPQLQVLSHPSVGGFITHCGWNSVIESVSMGVPMICWADTGERMSNQRFVVEFWKCGVPMVARSKGVTQHKDKSSLVGRDEVEKVVKFLMLDSAGAPIRARAAQLKGISTRAFQDSQNHFREFVLDINQKCVHATT